MIKEHPPVLVNHIVDEQDKSTSWTSKRNLMGHIVIK